MPIIGSLAGASSKSLGGLGASVIVLPSTGYISIASTTLTGTSPNFIFSSIPNTYKHLVIRGVARSNGSGTSSPMLMTFNGTSSTYNNQGLLVNQTGVGIIGYNDAPAHMYLQRCANSGTADSNYFGAAVFTIMDYNSNKHKTCFGEMGGALAGASSNNFAVGPYGGTWQDTSPITSITITPNSGSFVANSRFALYGIL